MISAILLEAVTGVLKKRTGIFDGRFIEIFLVRNFVSLFRMFAFNHHLQVFVHLGEEGSVIFSAANNRKNATQPISEFKKHT